MWLPSLLVVLLSCFQVDAECPPPDDIFPCFCKVVIDKLGEYFPVLSCHDLHSDDVLLRVLDVAKGYQLFELQLVNATLSYLPGDAFKNTTFVLVSIENSTIQALSDSDVAFQGLDRTLRMIEAVNCSAIANWDWTHLSHLRHLKEVVVTHSEILDITDGLSTIKHLDLEVFVFSGNKIRYLDEEAFAPFDLMTRITLDKNAIDSLLRSMFPRPALRLENLGLSYNKLTSLPRDLFQDMPALKSLFLTGNPLRTIDENVFKPVWDQIKLFFFDNTNLSCDCRLAWLKREDNSGKHIEAECHAPSHVQGRIITSLQMFELWCY